MLEFILAGVGILLIFNLTNLKFIRKPETMKMWFLD